MSAVITEFMVWNSQLNTMSKLNIDLENLKILPDQVKSLLEDLTNVKSDQKSIYDIVRKVKDRGSLK